MKEMSYNYLIKQINGDRNIVVIDEYHRNELLQELLDDIFDESPDEPWFLRTANDEFTYTVVRKRNH